MKANDFLPPIFFKLLGIFNEKDSYVKSYVSFDQAFKDSTGYNDKEIAHVVAEKTTLLIRTISSKDIAPLTAQNLFVIQVVCKYFNFSKINVVEVGGACGAFYYYVNHFLPDNILSWNIIETPNMVQAGKALVKDSVLYFETNYDAVFKGNAVKNLFIGQGVIQYLPNTGEFLSQLFLTGFEFIYLSRFPLLKNSSNPIITIGRSCLLDHGPGRLMGHDIYNKVISTPIVYLPHDDILLMIKQYNYEVVYQFVETNQFDIKIRGGNIVRIQEFGFLLQKKKN